MSINDCTAHRDKRHRFDDVHAYSIAVDGMLAECACGVKGLRHMPPESEAVELLGSNVVPLLPAPMRAAS